MSETDATSVGRYQIRELIGEGAMAKVYKAYDPQIDRTLAIKLMQSEFSRSDDYRLRFLREARGAGILSHPNIVTVFDVGEEKEQPYIAMELVEGLTLADIIKKKETLPARTVVEIGIELARALDYAHKKGIIHRDVKPANIMLVNDTNTVKVADFGICRIEGGDATQATRVGDVLGTPNYMSPEQVMGKEVDARSDLFSTGVVLYQLLTGNRPFEGDTLVTVALKIANSEPMPIDKLRPDLPLSLRRVIDRALRKQPEKRFQSGEEMAQALAAVGREMEEVEHVVDKKRLIPLRVRWALIMAAVVAVTMTLAGVFIQQRQYSAMLQQAIGYGGSLAKFMAAQTAVPILSEDWPQVEVFIQDAVNRQSFSYLQVIDHRGIVRGSSDASKVGSVYVGQSGGTPVPSEEGGITVTSHRLRDTVEILDFEAPIVFQNRTIGTLHLGIPQSPLKRVANLTMLLLGGLMLGTSVAVAVGSYFLAQRLSGPMRVLRNSLQELEKGHYDYRIAESRRDEFGELYQAFDATAAAVQKRHEPPHAPPV